MRMGTTYNLVCYSADGKERWLEFNAYTDMHELYPPGTFIKVSASRQWATGKSAVPRSDVPETALAKIMEGFTPSTASTLAEYADERTRQLASRNTPSLTVSCALSGSDLLYTYTYASGAKGMATDSADTLDRAYRSQFRTDKEAFPDLGVIYLEITLDDGTVVFSRKYDEIVRFGYELG
jgi:hypothetical protein